MQKYKTKSILICKASIAYNIVTIGKEYKIVDHRFYDCHEYLMIGDDGGGYWWGETTLEKGFYIINRVDNFDYAMGIL